MENHYFILLTWQTNFELLSCSCSLFARQSQNEQVIKNLKKSQYLEHTFTIACSYIETVLTKEFTSMLHQIIAGDPESVSETWMSNVYSYGMVLWEMVTGEEAYSTYSPVQAAVGIAACGLRPEIPRDCPHFLRSLMTRCWDNNPLKSPQFSEILSMLQRQNVR